MDLPLVLTDLYLVTESIETGRPIYDRPHSIHASAEAGWKRQAAKCPCNDCPRRSDCRSECDSFREYVSKETWR